MDEKTTAAINEATILLTSYGLDVIGALVILIVGWMFAGWASGRLRSSLIKSGRVDATLVPFLSGMLRYVLLAVVVVAVLGQFGIETASIIAVLGTAGLAIGLAMQGTLSHFAAGVVLLILRPFKVGDVIDTGSQVGGVEEIGMFATVLKTADGVYVYLPNGQLLGAAIKNFSRNPTRRIDIVVGIAYEDDVEKGLSVAKAVMEADDRLLKDPAPETMVTALADSSVNINMRCWVNGGDYWPVLFDLNKRVKLRMDEEGISIPFPQRDVHIIGQNDS